MTHDHLVEKASNFLKYKKNCSVVLKEFCAATKGGENPDVLGWKGGTSYMVECKTSRSDFLADRKKNCRKFNPNNEYWNRYGVGVYRYYFMPTGLVDPDEIPDNWGLVYLDGRSYTEVISSDISYHAKDKINDEARYNEPTMESLKNEILTLTSLVRRLSENDGECKYLL